MRRPSHSLRHLYVRRAHASAALTALLSRAANGSCVTFGSGQHGQLGHGNGMDSRPKRVEALTNIKVTYVHCGSTTTAALSGEPELAFCTQLNFARFADNGSLYIWGFGESIHPPELTNIVDSPRHVDLKEPVKKVVCGQSHIIVLTGALRLAAPAYVPCCELAETGDVYTFGSGHMGQLGHGAARLAPMIPSSLISLPCFQQLPLTSPGAAWQGSLRYLCWTLSFHGSHRFAWRWFCVS